MSNKSVFRSHLKIRLDEDNKDANMEAHYEFLFGAVAKVFIIFLMSGRCYQRENLNKKICIKVNI